MNRIDELFLSHKSGILSVYFTAGYPQLDDTVEVIKALEKQGGLIKEPKTSGGSGGFSVHIDGAKVKSYVTLESLFELSREVSDLRESYENRKDGLIDITYEVRKKIDTEKIVKQTDK